jgi:signal transduction histidine kinase
MISSTDTPAWRVLPDGPPHLQATSGDPASALIRTTEWQMRQFARDVHDTVGGAMTAVRFVIDQLVSAHPDELSVLQARAILDLAVADVRRVLRHVDPPLLEVGGLVPAIRQLVASYATIGAFAGRVRRHPIEAVVPAEISTTAYRVTQEALTNVARHAGATFVEVDLRQRRRSIELSISDDGSGFVVDDAWERVERGEGFGLRGMKERVELLGGILEIRSEPGVGTTIRAVLPFVPAARNASVSNPDPAA